MQDYCVTGWARVQVRAIVRATDAEQALLKARQMPEGAWLTVSGMELEPLTCRAAMLLDLDAPEALARYLASSGCVCPRCGGDAIRVEGRARPTYQEGARLVQEETCDDCGARWLVHYRTDGLSSTED